MRPTPGDEQVIPRIIHRIWFGGPVPEIFDYYEQSWRRHHPHWEMRLWREDNLPALSCQAEYDREPGIKRRVDIARLEILRQFGGVFIDMDCEAIRPLDPLLGGVSAFVGRVGRRHVGNQVLGAVPRHPFFELAVRRLASTAGIAETSSQVAAKAFLTQLLAEHPGGVTVFPPETFYFAPSFEPPRRPGDFPNVYAVHHELASYAASLPEKALEHRFKKFRKAVWDLLGELYPAGAAALPEEAQARLDQAERRLRRGVEKHDRGFRAQLRRVEAEREQAAARLRQAQLDAQCRIEELERRLASTAERLARLERRSLIAWTRRLVAGRPASRGQ